MSVTKFGRRSKWDYCLKKTFFFIPTLGGQATLAVYEPHSADTWLHYSPVGYQCDLQIALPPGTQWAAFTVHTTRTLQYCVYTCPLSSRSGYVDLPRVWRKIPEKTGGLNKLYAVTLKADDLKPVSPPIKHPLLVCSWFSIDSSRIQLFSNHQRLLLQQFLSIHLTDLANKKWNKSVVYSSLLFFVVPPSRNRAQNLTVLKMSLSWSSIDYCVNHGIQHLGMEVNSIKHRKSLGLCFSLFSPVTVPTFPAEALWCQTHQAK